MENRKYVSFVITLAMISTFALALPIFAQTNPGSRGGMGFGSRAQGQPGIFGTVSTINGTTLTVNSINRMRPKTSTNPSATSSITYTVDASNTTVTKSGASSTVSSIAVGDTVMIQGTINGINVTAKTIRDGVVAVEMGISGTVSSISGTTITVTSKARQNGGSATTYTVDALNATVMKNGATSSVSSISVGDIVMIQGTINGTSVTAKTIRDGAQPAAFQGNGQPVVAGKITAISGSTITITNTSNVTYTVDASSAKFIVGGTSSPTISSLVVGDNVIVQGTVNGTNITASSVIDQKANTNNNSGANSVNGQKPKANFFGNIVGGIGNFFKHMFGF